MRVALTVVALALVACRDRDPTCDAVADHVATLFGAHDEHGRDVQRVFRTRCEQDRWPAAMRTCLRETRALVEPKSCKQHLTSEARERLDAELAEVDRREQARTIPLACVAYAQRVEQLQTCTSVSPEVRAALATRLAEAKQEWNAMPNKQLLAPRCEAASYTLAPLVADCQAR